jgi:predicted nucleic acid-binding protein
VTLYLLDTNVVSEPRKRTPNAEALAFLRSIQETETHLSVMTLGELRRGAQMQRGPVASSEIGAWVDSIERRFGDRILSVDAEIARIWGELSAGRTRPVVDTLLAATAIRHGLTLVTRNVRDVQGIDVRLINPWNPR